MNSADSAHTEDHVSAHKRSSIHRRELLAADFCGCFHCCKIYSPKTIEEWVDDDAQGQGQTAMCPKCGIDSVISVSGDTVEVRAFLKKMRGHWFGE
jgi:hypothetical protein